MTNGLEVGQHVYVPERKLATRTGGRSAMVRAKVLELVGDSAMVGIAGGSVEAIQGRYCQPVVGALVLEIGDFASEPYQLDPLARSMKDFLAILLGPDDRLVELLKVRSLGEVECFWRDQHAAFRYIVTIGHGRDEGGTYSLEFGNGGAVDGAEFLQAFHALRAQPKVHVNLCCQSGERSFGALASSDSHCEFLIGSPESAHVVIASQFAQTFFAWHMLEGETADLAFAHACRSVPDGTEFRMWT